MAMTLSSIVPWGRSFQEYIDMFALSEQDLAGKILGCGDGPASFNSEVTRRGGYVISIDPIYQFATQDINNRIQETFDIILQQVQDNQDDYVWDRIPSVQALGETRMASMQMFLDDYDQGKRDRRYLPASLPEIPFEDSSFDLALCSHLLLLYGDRLSFEFHQQALQSMMRVAHDARIFPLVQLDGTRSPYLDALLEWCPSQGWIASVETVPYEFQRGGHEMLRLYRSR